MLTKRDLELREQELNQRWDGRKLRLIAIRMERGGLDWPYDITLYELQLVQDTVTKDCFTRALNGPSLTVAKEMQKIKWEYWTKVQELL